MAGMDWLGALLHAVGQGGNTYLGMKQQEKDRAIEAEQRAQAKADRDRGFAAQDRAFKQSQDQFDYGRAKDIYESSTPDQNFADSPDTLALLTKAGLPLNKRLEHTPGKATAPLTLPGQSVGLSAPPPPIGKQNDEFAPAPGPTAPPPGPMMSPVGGMTLGSVKDTATRPKTVQELAMEELQKAFGGGTDAAPNRMLTALTAKRAGVTLPADRVPQRLGIVPDSSFASGYALVREDPDNPGEEIRTESMPPASAGPSSGDVDFARRASAVLGRTVKPGEELAPADLKRVFSTDFTPPQGAAPKPPSMSDAAKVPNEYRIATQRALGASRRPVAEQAEIHNTVARLWEAQDIDGLHSYLRQMAVEGEPAALRERVGSRMYTADSLKEAKSLIGELRNLGVDTGLLEGSAENLRQWLGRTGDPRLASLGTQLETVLMDYRRAITGAAFTESEAKAYTKIWPNISNDFSLNNARIDGMLKVLQSADEHYWRRKLGDAGAAMVGAIPGTSASAANKGVKDVPGFPGYEAVTQPDGSVKIARKGGGGS